MNAVDLEELRDEFRSALCGPKCRAHEGAVTRLIAAVERREAKRALRKPDAEDVPPAKQRNPGAGMIDALRTLAACLRPRERVNLDPLGLRVRVVDGPSQTKAEMLEVVRMVDWDELVASRYPSLTLNLALDAARDELNRGVRERTAREEKSRCRP